MAEFEITISLRLEAPSIEEANERIDKALDAGFPPDPTAAPGVIELRWTTEPTDD
jgi:hypothetical protein